MGNPEQQAGDGGGRGVTLPPGGARREPLFRELFEHFPGIPFNAFARVLCETTIWTGLLWQITESAFSIGPSVFSCAGNSLSTLQYKTSLDQMFEGEKKVTASLVHTDWV